MISDDLIRQKLDSLHEHKMAKDIFVPLLKKLDGMKGVKYTGGGTEQGIDVEYYELAAPDKKRKYTGIQFKKGPLKYGAGGNKGTVKAIKNQAEEAFEKEIHGIDNDSSHKLSRFICAVTGEINEPARAYVGKAKREKGGNIDFWDGEYLCQLVRDHWIDEFIEYFSIDEKEVEEDEEEAAIVVDAGYIEANFAKLIRQARALKSTVNNMQWQILRAVLKLTVFNAHTAFDSSGASLADLLLELERTEEYLDEDLNQLSRHLDYLEFDNDNSVSLSGNARVLTDLGHKIKEEIFDAEETSDPDEIFSEVVF